MSDPASVKEQICKAFASVEYPGDWCLVDSQEGDEPLLLEEEFKGKNDWRQLDAVFIDRAPDGFGTALSFLSDEAFHFYLPAYLIADLDDLLKQADPVFHLTHGLDGASRKEKINSRRYGERTWFDYAQYKFAMFSDVERAAIAEYLRYKRDGTTLTQPERARVDEALESYWKRKMA